MTDHTKDLPRDSDGNLIVKELVKLPVAKLVHHLGQYSGGDDRAYNMAKRDADARMGRTQADMDLAYEMGCMRQAGLIGPGSSW